MVGVPAWAGPSQNVDPALEQRFRAEVAAASSDAAAAWDQGNLARDAVRLDEAEAAYRKVIELAPKLDHPHRRLCGVLVLAKRIDDALRECEVALSLAPASAYDKIAVVHVLMSRGRREDRPRAIALAHEAAQAMPDDVDVVGGECVARSLANDFAGLSACVEHLLKLAPDDMTGNVLATEIALFVGDYGRARLHLETAKKAGLPAAAYADLSARIAELQRRSEADLPISLDDILVVGVPLVGGWLAALGLLLVLGRLLSNSVLRGAGHLGADDPIGTPRERRLRRAYRSVLALTGLLFYLSLPLLILAVIAAAGVALLVLDEMGAIPIYVIFVIIIVVGSTVISVLRALFFKPGPKLEGKKIEPETFPRLGAVLQETADAIETRRVDVVYLVPDTEVGVLEYSSLRRAVFGGRSTRVLVLGVGLFDGMKQRELRAILAHEYGHFRNADTGGTRALAVQDSLVTLLRGIAGSGYARFNPAWWLLRAFTHLYQNVSSGASRLQERLADRWAIRAYGSEAFVRGLRHVIARDVEFTAHVSQTVKDVVDNQWSLPNLYEYDPELPPASVLEAEVAKRMFRKTPFDSHPPTQQRIEWAEQAALPGDRTRSDDLDPVWDLFPEPEQLERDMTAIIRERMLKVGVKVSDAEWDDEADPPAVEATSDQR